MLKAHTRKYIYWAELRFLHIYRNYSIRPTTARVIPCISQNWYEVFNKMYIIQNSMAATDKKVATRFSKTCLFKYIENFSTKTGKFSDKKKMIFFHIPAQNIDCRYSLEPPRRGGSNE